MATHAESSAQPRVPLNRARVLQAALTLADEGGIEALTMRKLGQALGIEAMSLYNHVANKDDILNGLVDLVMGEIELASASDDWVATIRRSAVDAHDALARHPWAVGLMMTPTRVTPARIRYMDSLLRQLREAGFSADLTYHAYHALDAHIFGFSLWQASHSLAAVDVPDLANWFRREFPPDEYPDMTEHVEQHLTEGSHHDVSAFEFGLDLILDGLEKLHRGS
jgi:AcrR family transcriptional regulator